MPPLPAVPGVTKVTISGTYHDTIWENIWFTHYTGSPPGVTDLNNYAAWIESQVIPSYADEMSVDNEVTGIKIVDLSSDTGAEYTGTVSNFGARTGDFNPANVCMVGSLEISRRYRGGHPRKYLPWGTSGTFASGSTKDWDSGFVADCTTKLATILSNLVSVVEGSTTWDNVVNVSYVTAGARRATAVVDVVTSIVPRVRVCSQRRRLGKVGG